MSNNNLSFPNNLKVNNISSDSAFNNINLDLRSPNSFGDIEDNYYAHLYNVDNDTRNSVNIENNQNHLIKLMEFTKLLTTHVKQLQNNIKDLQNNQKLLIDKIEQQDKLILDYNNKVLLLENNIDKLNN